MSSPAKALATPKADYYIGNYHDFLNNQDNNLIFLSFLPAQRFFHNNLHSSPADKRQLNHLFFNELQTTSNLVQVLQPLSQCIELSSTGMD